MNTQPWKLTFAAVLLGTLSFACTDTNTDSRAADTTSVMDQQKRIEEAASIYGQRDGILAEQKLLMNLHDGYKWGEVYNLNERSAKALIIMAFEQRANSSKMNAIRVGGEKKKAFDILYERTKSSLDVEACRVGRSNLQALCKITIDEWDAKSKQFKSVINYQAFARGSVELSWRPVALKGK